MNLIPQVLSNVSLMDKAMKVVTQYQSLLIKGAVNTVIVALIGTIVGLVIGLVIGAIRFVSLTHDRKDSKVSVIFKKILYFLTSCFVG